MTTPTSQAVDGVSEIQIVEIPIYIPTDIIHSLSEPFDSLSVDAMRSAINAIWHTSEANNMINTLRNSNATPHISSNQTLRSIRAGFEADLLDLDIEILRLHKAISDLSRQLAEASKKRIQRQNLANICTSLLSTLRRLPPETLGEIFNYCVPSHGRPAVTEAPLSLSQVCSSWRGATFTFPRLWANLSITTTPNKRSSDPNLGKIMKLWFDRARNLPLTLRFHNRYNSVYQHEDRSISTLHFLIPYAHRFQKLRLESDSLQDIRKFLKLPCGSMNALESLYLGITQSQGATLYVASIFDRAPLLRELTLRSDTFNIRPRSLKKIIWNQLTRIAILGSPIYHSELLEVLNFSDQLVSGTFSVYTGHDDSRPFGDKQHLLENLVDFTLSLVQNYDLEDQMSGVLDSLSFPSLSRLRINGDPKNGRLVDIPLESFLQNVWGLRSLTLIDLFYAAPEEMLLALKLTPHLVSLKINFNFDRGQIRCDEVIESLTYIEGQSSTYLPLLETLDITFLYRSLEFEFDEDTFIMMVKSRQIRGISPPPVPYLTVHLRVPNILSSVAEEPSHKHVILENIQDEDHIEISMHYTTNDDDDSSIWR